VRTFFEEEKEDEEEREDEEKGEEDFDSD